MLHWLEVSALVELVGEANIICIASAVSSAGGRGLALSETSMTFQVIRLVSLLVLTGLVHAFNDSELPSLSGELALHTISKI